MPLNGSIIISLGPIVYDEIRIYGGSARPIYKYTIQNRGTTVISAVQRQAKRCH